MPNRIRVKRMTGAMRIIHWVTVFCVVASIITGLYIAYPYYQSLIADPAVDKYVMAWNRWIHFISAIMLDVTAIVIAYLYFFSRFDRPYRKLIPNKANMVEFSEVFLNLVTLNRRKNFDTEHSDSFNTVFFFVLHIMLLLLLFTGLQMYVHGLNSGESSIGAWWPWILHVGTDWTLWIFDGKMGVRYVHHLLMWLVMIWAMFHIYYQVWRTIFWREGDIAIVFGGEKFVRKNNG